MSHVLPDAPKRVRFTWIAIATGVLSAALLSFSMSGTMSGFVAAVANGANNAVTGTLLMQETTTGASPVTCSSTDGGSLATNSATCSTIDDFGGAYMVPGDVQTTAVTIKNAGTVQAKTFTLKPGTCVPGTVGTANGGATDICSQLSVVVTDTTSGSTVYSGTLAALGSSSTFSLPAAPAGSSTGFSFAVSMPSALGNTYQGLQATVPLTWTFAS